MWHEAALPGMVVLLHSKVDTPASLRRSGMPIFGRVRVDITSLRAEMDDQRRVGVSMNFGALTQALASTGRTGFR
jgi:hypothetical protein